MHRRPSFPRRLSPPWALTWVLVALGWLAFGCAAPVDLPEPGYPLEPRGEAPAHFAQPPAGADDRAGRSVAPAPAPSAERSAAGAGAPSASEPRAAGRSAPRGGPHVSRPRPRQRPGLATHWGERRYSPVREVRFERANFFRPLAAERLEYDDRPGALRSLPRGRRARSELVTAGGAVTVRMVDASGRSFDALRAGDRLLAMGEPGERYSLVIENRTPERFEIVATVDGLDVLDGENGSLHKRGYLVDAYASIEIDGFRRSTSDVAAFRLGDVSGSYAASKGKARNVGVIGVAVFDERRPLSYRPPRRVPYDDHDRYLRETADPFPGSYAEPPRGR